MHTTTCARQLALVAMSAAIAGGAAAVPANAADARMSQPSITVSSVTTGPTMLDPPDRRRHRKHGDDDTPKMSACHRGECTQQAREDREARRKFHKEHMRKWFEQRDRTVREQNWRKLKRELKSWVDFRSPGVREREETLERIRDRGTQQGGTHQGGMQQGGMQPHPGP
ncbi:hypothetical protein [Nonomuraea sp. NPDC049400]|uniref:hypothetical protein n=1 Tax=Nonomuraea sp. NPDC049400 TaxID=3364352 RepID=UPI00379BF83C